MLRKSAVYGAVFLIAAGCAKGTVWVKPRENLNDLKHIAVLPFESNKMGLGDEISNRMVTALLQLGHFDVSDGSQVQGGGEGVISAKTVFNGSEADAVMTGSVRRYGNWFIGKDMNIDVKLISRSGGIVWTCNYKTDWAFTGLGTEGSLASKIVKEVVKRFKASVGP